MLHILHIDIKSKEEMIEATHDTINYYNENNPMKSFKGKTSAEVRKEALTSKTPSILNLLILLRMSDIPFDFKSTNFDLVK